MMQKLKRIAACAGIAATLAPFYSAAAAAARSLDNAQLPPEYAQLQRIVNNLSRNNDLGNQPLIFTIVPGGYAVNLATSLGLCDKESCSYYGQISPFKKYGGKTDEILRQNYLYGTIQGWAHSTGTVEITHQSFRIYGDREDLLSCTVAHELAHVIDNHSFHETKESSELAEGASEDQTKLINAQVSRKYEAIADKRSYEMMTRAGYPEGTCLEGLDFLHKSSGDGSITKPKDTHPGYTDRIAALKAAIDSPQKTFMDRKESTEGVWLYKPDMNYLKFSPISRQPR